MAELSNRVESCSSDTCEKLKTLYLHYDNTYGYPRNFRRNKTPWATKLGRVMTYNEELPRIKYHDHLITWSCEVK